MAVKRERSTPVVALPERGAFEAARWFAGKGRAIADVRVADVVAPVDAAGACVAIVDVGYAEGDSERYALPLRDGVECEADDPLWSALAGLAGVSAAGAARFVADDLSNTVVALGDQHLLKLIRRLETGPHPEAELLGALAGFGHVPALVGTFERDGSALVLVQEFVRGEPLGWEALISRLARGDEGIEDMRECGRVLGELHRALVRALGWRTGDERDAELALSAVEDELAASPPDVVPLVPALRARAEALAVLRGARLQRVHGDLHVGQILRADDGRLVVVDFEGEPGVPLAARVAERSPLVDLASLQLSFDHAACAAARRTPSFDWRRWSARARTEALSAYEDVAGEPVQRDLLRALEVAKELRELAYATRWLPEWRYAPLTVLPTLVESTR